MEKEAERMSPLGEGDRKNFATLQTAGGAGDLALMRSRRKADEKEVALVCAMGWDGVNYITTPLAVMVEGNPFDMFEDPTAEPQEISAEKEEPLALEIPTSERLQQLKAGIEVVLMGAHNRRTLQCNEDERLVVRVNAALKGPREERV